MAVDTSQRVRQGPPKFINTLVAVLLRSPLHGLVSKSLLLLTFRGHKSGKLYTLPVGYRRQGKTVEVFTDHSWWKNLRDQAAVTLCLQGKTLQGTAEVISDETELVAGALVAFVRKYPRAAGAYGVKLDSTGQPDLESARQAASRFKLVRIHLV